MRSLVLSSAVDQVSRFFRRENAFPEKFDLVKSLFPVFAHSLRVISKGNPFFIPDRGIPGRGSPGPFSGVFCQCDGGFRSRGHVLAAGPKHVVPGTFKSASTVF